VERWIPGRAGQKILNSLYMTFLNHVTAASKTFHITEKPELTLNAPVKKSFYKVWVQSTSEVDRDLLVRPQTEDYYENVNSVGHRGAHDGENAFRELLNIVHHSLWSGNLHCAYLQQLRHSCVPARSFTMNSGLF